MADTSLDTNTSVPALPVENILYNVAHSVVVAQKELDAASMAMATKVVEEELDTQFGLSAQWYTIPEVDFSLKLAFEVASNGKLQSQMVDAEYQSKYGFNVQASSLLQTKIMAVPPPVGSGMRMLSKDGVIALSGRLKRIVEIFIDSDSPHFIVRYYPFSTQGYNGGLWFVMLMDIQLSGQRDIKALTVIDDMTSQVLRVWTYPDNADTVVKTVPFTFEEAFKVLDLVNHADYNTLDVTIGVDSRAVDTIIAARPYYSMETLGSVNYLGTVSLQNLKNYALTGSI